MEPVVADFPVPHPGHIIANLKLGTGPHEKWYFFTPPRPDTRTSHCPGKLPAARLADPSPSAGRAGSPRPGASHSRRGRRQASSSSARPRARWQIPATSHSHEEQAR